MRSPRWLLCACSIAVAIVAWRSFDTTTGSEEAGDGLLGCAAPDRPPCTAQAASTQHLDESHLRGGGWTLARSINGDQWLRVYTRSRDGFLSLRIEGAVVGSIPEILSILREVDLLPLWNRFCDVAMLLHLVSPSELWVAAGVKLPWPVPQQSLFLRASVADDPQSKQGIVALAQSPSASATLKPPEGVRLPTALQRRLDLPVPLASGRLQPLAANAGDGMPRTRLDIFMTFDVSGMAFLAGAASAPRWIVNMVVWVVVRPRRIRWRAPRGIDAPRLRSC